MTSSTPAEPTQREVHLDTPFTDQKPGTSGLRKSSKQFEQPNYLESFVEAALRTLPGTDGGTLVVGGDGRYGNIRAIDVILRMAAAHGLGKVIVTTGGILSTPAASHLIRSKNAIGGIILSASHNPGGPDGDFGVKVNGANGGPTPASYTDAVFECTKTLSHYSIVDATPISLKGPGQHSIGAMSVEVIDGVDDFVALMQQLFDFDEIKGLLRNNFPLAFDAMHAVTGPYATRILEGLLGAPAGSVRNGVPLEDFGKGQMGCRRCGEDPAGGDDYFSQPMGGCHAQDHIDGTNVAVTTVATHHQGAAIRARQRAQCCFYEAFEVVRLLKLLAAFAQARGARFLVGEWGVEMNLTLGRFRRGRAGHLNGYGVMRNLNPGSALFEVEPTS